MNPKRVLITLLFCLFACGAAAADIPASTLKGGKSVGLNHYKKIRITAVNPLVTRLKLQTPKGATLFDGKPSLGQVFDLSGYSVVRATGYMGGGGRRADMNAIKFRALR